MAVNSNSNMMKKKSKLVEIKTKPTLFNVREFIQQLENIQQQKDCLKLLEMMERESESSPVLWSNSIVGFDKKIFESPKTGRAVEWFSIGFAPRKTNLSIYLTAGIKTHAELLKKLGKYKAGVGCLYIKQLADIDIEILEELIKASVKKKD